MNPLPPSGHEDEDDAAWFEALMGRPAEGAELASWRDATELRHGLLSLMDARLQRAGVEVDGGRAWERLRERARREGLIEESAAATAPSTPPSGLRDGRRRLAAAVRAWMTPRSPRAGMVAMAAVALVVVGVGVSRFQAVPPDDVLRGAGGVAALRASDPASMARALSGELTRAGARVHDYPRPGGVGLDVDWPADRDTAVRAVLTARGMTAPSGASTVRIDIVRP